MAMVVALAMSAMGAALADDVTPSTNDDNKANGWSHFVVDEVRVGEVDITFNQPRWFAACFEYRSDGEEPTYEQANFNTDIEDGLWSYICLGDAYARHTYEMTLEANEYVEIRLVFGAERSERFDWTSVDVLPAPEPGEHGRQNAQSTPAGERANQNARFNR